MGLKFFFLIFVAHSIQHTTNNFNESHYQYLAKKINSFKPRMQRFGKESIEHSSDFLFLN